MAGYHWLAPMAWVDAFLNAAMLLGGMGPVDPLTNDAVKVYSPASMRSIAASCSSRRRDLVSRRSARHRPAPVFTLDKGS